jgi:hypothetical protein
MNLTISWLTDVLDFVDQFPNVVQLKVTSAKRDMMVLRRFFFFWIKKIKFFKFLLETNELLTHFSVKGLDSFEDYFQVG